MAGRHYDVIVIGVGAMGASACYHLARRGVNVLGLDRHAIPNSAGSSHGRNRVFRLAYYEHHDYVPLLLRAQELWFDIEAEAGVELLTVTGGVWMGPADSDLVLGTVAAAKAHRLAHSFYETDALRERMPGFNLPDGTIAAEESEAGVLYPERTIATLARLAMTHGASLHGHEAVESWSASDSGVVVQTPRASYSADKLVLAPGAWAPDLLASLGVEFNVTRQMQLWVAPPDPTPFALGTMPLWAIEHAEAGLQYGFPVMPDAPGLKIAKHHPGETTSAHMLDTALRESDTTEMRTLLRTTLPSADGPIIAAEACMYTNAPDRNFIIDTHPDHEHVVVACGFSGHGFKFTPVIGEVLADLAMHGRTELPAQFLSLARLAGSEHVTTPGSQ